MKGSVVLALTFLMVSCRSVSLGPRITGVWFVTYQAYSAKMDFVSRYVGTETWDPDGQYRADLLVEWDDLHDLTRTVRYRTQTHGHRTEGSGTVTIAEDGFTVSDFVSAVSGLTEEWVNYAKGELIKRGNKTAYRIRNSASDHFELYDPEAATTLYYTRAKPPSNPEMLGSVTNPGSS